MAAGMYMDTRLQQQFWGNPYWQSDLYEPPPPTPNPHPPIGRLARPGLLVIPPIVPAPLTPTPVVLMREIERYNKKRNAERAERLAAAQPADRPAGPPVRPRRRRIWDDMFFDDLPPTPPPRRASAPAPVARVTPSQPLNELTAPAPSIAAPAPVSRVAPLQPLKELNGVISDSTKKAPLPLPLAASNVNVSVEGSAKVSAKASKLLPVSAKQLSFRTWLGDDENATTTATAVRPSCVCETALQQSSDASRLAELRIDIPSLGAAAAIGAAVPTGSSCAELGHATAGHASLQVGSVAIAIA
ncbi:hypothetical protein CLOP_g11290 [Closterium sp. NIES-67]|nr:hypothetical protein CLOP_g11290 [Closterium sp. NIES-67]